MSDETRCPSPFASLDSASANEETSRFLDWLAGWLDKIDPILQAVFESNRIGSAYTYDERGEVVEWLKGHEVQDRLRALAEDFRSNPNESEPTRSNPE